MRFKKFAMLNSDEYKSDPLAENWLALFAAIVSPQEDVSSDKILRAMGLLQRCGNRPADEKHVLDTKILKLYKRGVKPSEISKALLVSHTRVYTGLRNNGIHLGSGKKKVVK